jgi:hypothetical protein
VAQEAFTLKQLSEFSQVKEGFVRVVIQTFRELLHEEKRDGFLSYRIYHASFQEFLSEGERIQKAEYHLRIAKTYTNKYDKDWRKAKENYPFMYLAYHYFEACEKGYRGLCQLVENDEYRNVKLDKLDILKPVLDDIRYALLGDLREDDLPRIVKYAFLYPETIEKGKRRGSVLDFDRKGEYEKTIDRAMLYQNESVRFKFLLLIADVARENGDFDKVEEVVKMALGISNVSLDKKEDWILVNVLYWLIQGEKKFQSFFIKLLLMLKLL